jgi:hypothetical protein
VSVFKVVVAVFKPVSVTVLALSVAPEPVPPINEVAWLIIDDRASVELVGSVVAVPDPINPESVAELTVVGMPISLSDEVTTPIVVGLVSAEFVVAIFVGLVSVVGIVVGISVLIELEVGTVVGVSVAVEAEFTTVVGIPVSVVLEDAIVVGMSVSDALVGTSVAVVLEIVGEVGMSVSTGGTMVVGKPVSVTIEAVEDEGMLVSGELVEVAASGEVVVEPVDAAPVATTTMLPAPVPGPAKPEVVAVVAAEVAVSLIVVEFVVDFDEPVNIVAIPIVMAPLLEVELVIGGDVEGGAGTFVSEVSAIVSLVSDLPDLPELPDLPDVSDFVVSEANVDDVLSISVVVNPTPTNTLVDDGARVELVNSWRFTTLGK